MSEFAVEFECSRSALVDGDDAVDVDTAVRAATASVADAELRAAVFTAKVGEIRRVDVWVTSASLVVHGFDDDPDTLQYGLIQDRSGALPVIAGLLGIPRDVPETAQLMVPDLVTPRSGNSSELLRDVAAGELRLTDGGTPPTCGVALIKRPGSPTRAITVIDDGATWWSAGEFGDTLDLRVGEYGHLWSELLGILEPMSAVAA